VCKYVVPEGYGVKSVSGKKIFVDEELIKNTGSKLFYASVNKTDHEIYTTTSRSLAVVGVADDLSSAENICENALNHIKGDYIFIRHDIGTRELIEKRVRHMNELRGTI
jgi:phosphoribosylamine--glycine ligase